MEVRGKEEKKGTALPLALDLGSSPPLPFARSWGLLFDLGFKFALITILILAFDVDRAAVIEGKIGPKGLLIHWQHQLLPSL